LRFVPIEFLTLLFPDRTNRINGS